MDKHGWFRVEDRLPEMNDIVQVSYPNGFDGAPVYAYGARLDEGEGWLWGVARWPIRPDQDYRFNDIEADEDYPVTHWQLLPHPPEEER